MPARAAEHGRQPGPDPRSSIAMSAPPPALLLLLLLGLAAASLLDTRSKEEKFYINSLEDAIEDFTQSIYVDLATKSGDENFVFSPLRNDSRHIY